VSYGGSQTFTITPNPGYDISDVKIDGVSQGPISSYTFTNVTSGHTISATFVLKVYSITASAGSGGTISPSGSVPVNYGAGQTFTITPNTNYAIADVVVNGSSVGAQGSYTISNVTSNQTITASFVLQTQCPAVPDSNSCSLPASYPGSITGSCINGATGSCSATCNSGGSWGPITNNCNRPPVAPTIDGPASLLVAQVGTFGFTSTDPESDQIKYEIDWDNNGSVDLTLPVSGYTASGNRLTQNNNWGSPQTATFKARAVDSGGRTSGWTSKTVTISVTPDLIVSVDVAPSPVTVQDGQSVTLTATVKNQGSGTAVGTFPNIIQLTTDPAHAPASITNYRTNDLSNLAANTTATISLTRVFSPAATYYARACADLDASMVGVINEGGNEGNNCGNWSGEGAPPQPPVTVNPNLPCAATTINNCDLAGPTPSGNTVTGSCAVAPDVYYGSCSYTCTNTVWGAPSSNTCQKSNVTLNANPHVINNGQAVVLTWSSNNPNTTRCDSMGGFTGGTGPSGTDTVHPTYSPTPYNYQVKCFNPGNKFWLSNIESVVVSNASATITLAPNRVNPGGATTVTWTANDVTTCSITKNGAAWKPGLTGDVNHNVSGSQAGEAIARQTTYIITCQSVEGSTVTAKAVANVTGTFAPF
jgi:hypothetical protein